MILIIVTTIMTIMPGYIASQLERTGEAMRIHVSSESKTLLDKVGHSFNLI